MENRRKYQTEATELQNTINEVKNTLLSGSIANQMKQKKGSLTQKTEQWNAPKQSRKKNFFKFKQLKVSIGQHQEEQHSSYSGPRRKGGKGTEPI